MSSAPNLLRLLRSGVVLCALVAETSYAFPATFIIDQVFSTADGVIQFIEARDTAHAPCDAGQEFWAGQPLISTGPDPQRTFIFPTNLPTCNTPGRHVLVASQGFAALGLVAPDYVFPNGFLQVPAGTVALGNADSLTYTNLPLDGAHAVNEFGQIVPAVATNLAGNSASVLIAGGPPPAALNYEGLFWAAPAGSESGWGINFEHQGDVIFATWFTYDASGRPWWLSTTAFKASDGTFSGSIMETRGPAFNSQPFDPTLVTSKSVGDATLSFADVDNGTFTYTVNGTTQTKAITRQVFAAVPTCAFGAQTNLALATNYQGLWWASPAASESGWGVNFTHQGDFIFATWFTYDAAGAPLWLSGTAKLVSAGTYTGTLYRTSGPSFNSQPFDPAKVVLTPVGTITLTFSNGNSGTFGYTVDLGGTGAPVTQVKSIVRQVFREPGTICH